MTIWWSDLFAKFKGNISYNDVTRIVTRFARAGLRVEPIAASMSRLNKHDTRRDWFPTEWRQQLDASMQRISAQESRKAQGLMCRRELLRNTEKVALNDFLMLTKDDDVRNYWLSVKYTEQSDLNDRDRFELLVMHYAYSLLNQLGLEGLHWQQFNKEVDIDEVIDPYRAICGMDAEIQCKTLFATVMLELDRVDLEIVMLDYLGIVSEPLLRNIRQAKDDYAAWISEGNTEGIGEFRDRFTSLLSAHSAAVDNLNAAKTD